MVFILQQVQPNKDKIPIEIPLNANEVKIGRKTHSCLKQYLQMSRYHATFYKSDDGNLFVKNTSLNGVYVNNEKIDKSRNSSNCKLLSPGDCLGFGLPVEKCQEGFVCVLKEANNLSVEIIPEIIVISESDDSDEDQNSIDSSTNSFISSGNRLATVASTNSTADQTHFASDEDDMPVKTWVVRLGYRCDSEVFQWPPDVKKTFSPKNTENSSDNDVEEIDLTES